MKVTEITLIGDFVVGVDPQGRLVKHSRGRWILLHSKPQRDRREYFRARHQRRKAEREAAHV